MPPSICTTPEAPLLTVILPVPVKCPKRTAGSVSPSTAAIFTVPSVSGLMSIFPPSPSTVPVTSTSFAFRVTVKVSPAIPLPAKMESPEEAILILSALMETPFPTPAPPKMVMIELPTAGLLPSVAIVTVLPSPPLTVTPPPLSTIPYPAAVEPIVRFLKPSMAAVPFPSVNTASSCDVTLISPVALMRVVPSLMIPLSVHLLPAKSVLIVMFLAFTSASLMAAPSPRESSVQLMTKFRSG